MTWQPELDELRRRQELADRMGGPEKIARQHQAGRLTVRERLAALLDEGSFHEIGALAGTAAYDVDGALAAFTPANFVAGTGRRPGRCCATGCTTRMPRCPAAPAGRRSAPGPDRSVPWSGIWPWPSGPEVRPDPRRSGAGSPDMSGLMPRRDTRRGTSPEFSARPARRRGQG